MPLFSCFTPFGHLAFSSRASHGELFYRQLFNTWGGNYSAALGSRSEARAYATAMLLARARYAKERVANQMDPNTVEEMLPVREFTYGLAPGRNDTENDRRKALAAKYKLPQGAAYTVVANALLDLLGSDFLNYRITKPSEILAFPSNPATVGRFNDFRLAPKIVTLTSPVALAGSPVAVTYQPLDVRSQSVIAAGDVLVVSANNIGLAEPVTVTAASPGSFTAVFTKSHDVGDVGTTGYFPYWTSTQGHVLVIVTPTAAADPEKRRKVHTLMTEIMRGWVTWDIVASTNGIATDPIAIGDPILGRIGYTGLGAVSFP